ncbi:unnamed protein product [Callosobruchus maculatus]|uniref:Reverse transcriptase domain-containing protein n=1 Tax=Callosobruchus maculatus TaxID=64391 RepID=A0A653DHW5_CALMS|nr:unnamed protein product [Callosobruchus maculatus]
MLAIEDFKLISCYSRTEGKHGGAAVYARTSVDCRALPEVCEVSSEKVIECAGVECFLKNERFVIVSLYRPPAGNIDIFFNKLEKLINLLFNTNRTIVVAGDFNIELLRDNKHKTQLLSLMSSFQLFQTIFEDTRRTSEFSASCIDNIFTNQEYVRTETIENFVSDHKAQKITFESPEAGVKNIVGSIRIFSDDNTRKFLSRLLEEDWVIVYEVPREDVNNQWNVFINYFSNIFFECFPLTPCRPTNIKISSPEIDKCKSRLDILLTLSDHDQRYKDEYSKTKKEYDNLLKKSRSIKYENRMMNSDNKNKCMWAICREITGKTAKNEHNLGSTEDIEKLPDIYNAYILSVVPNMLKQLEKKNVQCNIKQNTQPMILRPTTPEEVCELGKEIKNKHTAGIDGIPTKNNILAKNQHGYLKGRSTQTAIFDFIQIILHNLENGISTLGMFLDLSRAYDCLDRNILLQKLQLYGVGGKALNWICTYISDRQQKVDICKNGRTFSSSIVVNSVGIAQGSILGPVLFLIYINDLYSLDDSPHFEIISYADDTNLIIGNKQLSALLDNVNEYFSQVNDWCLQNKLIINKNKTDIILFRTKQSGIQKPKYIQLDNNQMNISNTTKFLGIHLNESLDWTVHIESVANKLNSICYGLRVIGRAAHTGERPYECLKCKKGFISKTLRDTHSRKCRKFKEC